MQQGKACGLRNRIDPPWRWYRTWWPIKAMTGGRRTGTRMIGRETDHNFRQRLRIL
jgi:hypothetical protein